ncbi:MAG: D-alanyl-D-alanine carboxypeptidase [Candidatus Krumholzibacteria bacterium]|nr:D-alanyl-D-alanine carboxypeptidase [Candidatus Krumholzibacteria bacterium]
MKKTVIAAIAFGIFVSTLLLHSPAANAAAGTGTISQTPYLGAILVNAATGKVLFEDRADEAGYPASMVKLMDLLIVLDMVESNVMSLDDSVKITAAASRIGGSQVYLKENEVFTVDELLYALIVQSANDAAVALALHVAGTKEAFVDMMNEKARELGMTRTEFHSVHGLPPARGQQPDVTTARDMTKLCIELLRRDDVLRYTSTKERTFRPDSPTPFIMRTHNHVLRDLEGCDGLKTGYFTRAGFSVAATATKKGARALAVVLGSEHRKVRDAKATELLSRGLAEIIRTTPAAELAKEPAASAKPKDKPSVKPKDRVVEAGTPISGNAVPVGTVDDETIQISKKKIRIAGFVTLPLVAILIGFFVQNMRRRRTI